MLFKKSRLVGLSECFCHLLLAVFFLSLQAKGQDLVQRSVLGPVLPEAMVCYLENYEAERISEIFLGEFDTPEAIWSSEMRYNFFRCFFFCAQLKEEKHKTLLLFELFVPGG